MSTQSSLFDKQFSSTGNAASGASLKACLPDVCVNRHKGNPESEAANRKIASQKRNLQAKVYEFILRRTEIGTTLKEVVRFLDMPIQTASARIAELKALNQIEATGIRREGCAVLVAKFAKENA